MGKQCFQKRIQALKKQVMNRKGSFVTGRNPFIMDVALWRVLKKERSVVQTRAALLREEVAMAPLDIPADWTLAGEHLPMAQGPVWGVMRNDLTDEVLAPIYELGVEKDQIDDIIQQVKIWTRSCSALHYTEAGELDADKVLGCGDWSTNDSKMVYMARGWIENHSIRDFAKILKIGFDGVRKEIENSFKSIPITDPDYPRKENFLKAALSICEAGELLGERYSRFAKEKAERTNDPNEKARYLKMAETCGKVPKFGAETLFEATQSLWFAHILTCGEDSINANSIGRLDQILQPYYEADLKTGTTTRDDALELMCELACKLYLDYDVQAITLGGVDADGNSSVNDMSHIILDATDTVEFIRDVSVRLGETSPDDFIEHCARLIVKGGGIPFIFNDDCFVRALNDRGIELHHARDYAPIGCIELTIPGKANPHAVSGWFNSLKCLELALFGGVDPQSGVQVGLKNPTLAEMTSFEDVYNAYLAQMDYFADRVVYHCNRGELLQRERGPLPCWSVMTDDCIKRGRDITDGGPLYNYHSICFMGVPDTADSLMALKKLVFDEKKITPPALLDALKTNFKGKEDVRQMLLKDSPKYGNDFQEVDELAAKISDYFIDYMDKQRSPLNGRYVVHLFTFLLNIRFGGQTGATPDGRKSGEPLAYSLSAHQGRDEKGVTAMIKSLSKLPHQKAAGSSAAIIDVTPKLVQGEEGIQRMVAILKTLLAMKVGQAQFNVVTAERLEQARKDPENYGNIPVRVAGYSQMFKLISTELQDHIIARTKHEK